MQSGAESLDTIATWWQEMSTLSSLPKNYLGLKARQSKNTSILLPNVEKVRFSFLEETYLDGQITPLGGCWAGVTKNHMTFLKIQYSFKSTWFQGSKYIIKGARA